MKYGDLCLILKNHFVFWKTVNWSQIWKQQGPFMKMTSEFLVISDHSLY